MKEEAPPTSVPSVRTFRDVTVMRSRRFWQVAFVLSLVAMLTAGGAMIATGLGVLTIYLVLYGCVVPLALASKARAFAIDRRDAKVVVDGEGIHLDGRLVVPRGKIREALSAPTLPNGGCVRIERGFQEPLELWLSDANDAHALVKSLRLDPSRKLLDRRARSPLAATRPRLWATALLPVLLAVVAATLSAPLFFVALVVAAVTWTLAARPTRVTVGSDGVSLRWGGRRRFIPLSDIWDVGEHRGFVRLLLRSGQETIDIPISSGRRLYHPLIAFDVAILADRIREAIRARQGGGAAFDASLLERSQRSVRDWLGFLHELSAGARAYRAVLHGDDLWRILEDGAKPSALRAAAAVVLGQTPDERGKARLRIAADTSAVPKLRVALDAVARADQAAIEGALTALDADEPAGKKRSHA